MNNATEEFNVNHHTNILNLADEELRKEVELLLYFIGEEALEYAQDFLKLNSNQTNDINRMENIKNKIIKLGNKKIDEIFNFFDLYAKPEIKFDNTNLSITTEFNNDEILFGDPINQQNNSAGYKSIFCFVLRYEYLIEYAKKNNKEIILIIDELDKNLHPMLQSQLIAYIKSRIEESNIYLIISTHSPFLLEMDEKFSNYYVAYKKQDGSLNLSLKNTFSNSGAVSSFLVLAKKVLDSHEILMKIKKPRLVILESSSQDDIQILKARVNKKIDNVEFVLQSSDPIIGKDIEKVIDHPNDLTEIEVLLENNQRIFISKKVIDILKNED
ncbi:AAA family ATPase [Spiroplasma sp. SV19]|uniref:AAA family ATPase n=1 Tax=Spiroplasma sp. SV19 TaxID=2570468 RepID=UPI0032D570FD